MEYVDAVRMSEFVPDKSRLPAAIEFGDADAPVGIVCVGILGGVVAEAIERLSERGMHFHCHRPRTLWPLPAETAEFVNAHERVYVIEQSEGAQLRALLQSEGAHAEKIRSILKYDGLQFTVGELVDHIVELEQAL